MNIPSIFSIEKKIFAQLMQNSFEYTNAYLFVFACGKAAE